MPQDAPIAGRLLRRVRARNRELMTEMAVELGMGLLFTALTVGFLYWLLWFICLFLGGIRAAPLARWMTALFMLVAAISAWRRVDPFAGLRPMTGAERLMVVAGGLAGHGQINLHSIAGFASLLMGGPENLICALRSWLHRLPTDPALLDQAAEVLVACKSEIDLKSQESSATAVVLLRRLNLIVPRGESKIALTEKGRDVVGRKSPPAEIER